MPYKLSQNYNNHSFDLFYELSVIGEANQSLQYPDNSREVVPRAVSKTRLPFAFFFS